MAVNVPSRLHEPEEPHDVSRPHAEHHVPYLKVFFALVLLTIFTVAIGIYLRFPQEVINVLLALAVASIKGTLVAMYFMHLKFEGKLIYLIFISPLILCVLLIVALLPDIVPVGDSSLTHFNAPPMYKNVEGH